MPLHAARTASRLRSALWPTVFLIPMLLVLLGLGTWQLQRLHWKTDLIAMIATRTTAEPVPMPAAFDDPDAWNFRRVRVEGRWLHDRELFLAPRTLDGRIGYHLVTPLVRTDPAAPGDVVLVNRGWIPEDRRDPATRPESRPEGTVTVDGILRTPSPRPWLRPDNDPAANLWFWIDLPAMAAAAGIEDPPPLILEAGATPPGSLPVGGQTRLEIPNDHLQYALTWYGLAAVLIAIYIVYLRRPPPQPDRSR